MREAWLILLANLIFNMRSDQGLIWSLLKLENIVIDFIIINIPHDTISNVLHLYEDSHDGECDDLVEWIEELHNRFLK